MCCAQYAAPSQYGPEKEIYVSYLTRGGLRRKAPLVATSNRRSTGGTVLMRYVMDTLVDGINVTRVSPGPPFLNRSPAGLCDVTDNPTEDPCLNYYTRLGFEHETESKCVWYKKRLETEQPAKKRKS